MCVCRDNSDGIATRSGLAGSGDRNPVLARFSGPVQTKLGVHPASCTVGTGSFPGGKSAGGGGVHHSPHLSPRLGKSRAVPLLHLLGFMACSRVKYTLLYYTLLYFTILYIALLYFAFLYFTLLYFSLFYFTLFFTLLFFALLYFTLLYFTILYFSVLYFTILYSAVLCFTFLYFNLLYFSLF